MESAVYKGQRNRFAYGFSCVRTADSFSRAVARGELKLQDFYYNICISIPMRCCNKSLFLYNKKKWRKTKWNF